MATAGASSSGPAPSSSQQGAPPPPSSSAPPSTEAPTSSSAADQSIPPPQATQGTHNYISRIITKMFVSLLHILIIITLLEEAQATGEYIVLLYYCIHIQECSFTFRKEKGQG